MQKGYNILSYFRFKTKLYKSFYKNQVTYHNELIQAHILLL